ncbi:MAG: NVEALA domain-containing protein [Clostridium sp.]|nr:NVEALA domain-containing protein [Bacteroides sp.]MCM1198104.1 NVEALA domain-containing protein [Clostridium sp.]
MKHKLLVAAGAVLAAAAVSVFVHVRKGNNVMDEFFDANVEALANDESTSGSLSCFRQLTEDSNEQALYCGTCSDVPGRGSRKSICFKK